MKRSVSFLLLFFLLKELTFAQTFSGGSGTVSDPYQIGNMADLVELSTLNLENATTYWTQHYILTSDIDFGINAYLVDWNGDGILNWNSDDSLGFMPIGSPVNESQPNRINVPFTGTFNGKGHVISNLYINRQESYLGVFGFIVDGKIDSLGVSNIIIESNDEVCGGIVGGIATSDTDSASINNSFVAGGFINTTGSNVGGLAGYCNSTKVNNCYASIDVTAGGAVGGLIGAVHFSSISNCYASGKVTKSNNANLEVGGFVGYVFGNSSSINKSYWDQHSSGQIYSGTLKSEHEILPLKPEEFKLQSSFSNWDFNCTWKIGVLLTDRYFRPRLYWQETNTNVCLNPIGISIRNITDNSVEVSWHNSGDSYNLVYGIEDSIDNPYSETAIEVNDTSYTLNSLKKGETYSVYIQTYCGINNTSEWVSTSFYLHTNNGDGTADSPYLIENKKDLISVSKSSICWNKNFIQIANIEFNEDPQLEDWNGDDIVDWNSVDSLGFYPIATEEFFTGSYNGHGHIIKNLYINREGGYNGLFSGLSYSANVDSLGLESIHLTSGVLVGGIAGISLKSKISNCYTQGFIEGNTIGGILGQCENTSLKNSYASVNLRSVSDHKYIGGVIGWAYYSNYLENCYATGKIDTLYDCSYGGLVGWVSNTLTTKSCYWDTITTEINYASSNVNYQDAADPLGSNAFNNINNFQGWDFINTWIVSNSVDCDTMIRPRLQWQLDLISIEGSVFGLDSVVAELIDSNRISITDTIQENFRFRVEKGSTVILRPSKETYSFAPDSVVLTNVINDVNSIDFNAFLKIRFSVDGNGSINGSQNILQEVEFGKDASPVSVSPANGYHFTEWRNLQGDSITNENPLVIESVFSDSSFVAVIEIDTYNISFTTDGNGYLNGEKNQTVILGNSTAEIEAVPEIGFHFVEWQNLNGDSITNENPLVIENVVSDSSLVAIFEINQYIISFATDGNGSLNGETEQVITYGSFTTEIEAVPNNTFQFVEWQNLNGDSVTNENPLILEVISDSSLIAIFQTETATYYNYVESKIIIYPNPTVDYISVIGIVNKDEIISIYNCQGQKLMEVTNYTNKINVSNLKKGIYIIEIGLYKQKFIIE